MKRLGAIHFVYDNKQATEEAIKSFRNYYPDNYYILIGDGGADHNDLALKYNCAYIHSDIRLGYPNNHFGYNKDGITEYLKRIYNACTLSNSSHLILMEDDVHIINDISFRVEDEMLATQQSDTFYNGDKGNIIHPYVMNLLNCDNILNNWYAAGGGCIFNTKTFIQNYEDFLHFYNNHFDFIQNKVQSIIGWPDYSLNLLYLYCGKINSVNSRLYEFRNPSSYEYLHLKEDYDILHHYKKYYK
jgi:hypothetical protein